MEVAFDPCHPSSFCFFPGLKHLPLCSVPPRGRRAGSQARQKPGGAGQGEVGQPQAKEHVWCFLPTLMFHFPRLLMRRAHGTRRNGGEWRMGRSTPWPLAHLQSRAAVLSGAEMEHPHEPETIPLDRVRKEGEEEAAPAATQPDIQGKGHERL